MSRKSRLCLLVVCIVVNCLSFSDSSLATPPAATSAEIGTISGTITETMNVSGYTYMLVSNPRGETWVAVPATSVQVGDTVTYYDGMVMSPFSSKSLDRTFESIVFSPGLATEKALAVSTPIEEDSFAAAVKAEKLQPQATPLAAMSGGSAGAIAPLNDEISIDKSAAPNGFSIAEIFTEREKLNTQQVQVRGKVVKFNPMIMGRNWIHLQDGSGDPMQNTHDLVATSSETVEVGTVVLLEGILAANKDFGAGYKYSAILEEAKVLK